MEITNFSQAEETFIDWFPSCHNTKFNIHEKVTKSLIVSVVIFQIILELNSDSHAHKDALLPQLLISIAKKEQKVKSVNVLESTGQYIDMLTCRLDGRTQVYLQYLP